MDSKTLIKTIKAEGWELVHARGSHHKFKHPDKPGTIVISHPKKDLSIGQVNDALKKAGLK